MHGVVTQYPGALQATLVLLVCLIAWFSGTRLQVYLKKGIENASHPGHVQLDPRKFSQMVMLILAFAVLWILFHFFKGAGLPSTILRFAVNGLLASVVLYYVFNYTKTGFWFRSMIVLGLSVLLLQLFGFWAPFIQVLDGISLHTATLKMSLLGLLKALITFSVLLSAANLINKLFNHFISISPRMHHSDQLLVERAFRVVTTTVVILITLASAGVDMTILAFAGGAAGFMIGVGLQEIGSNLVCGIALLLRKPISQGNLILLDHPLDKGFYVGKIIEMGLLYVRFVTRDGTSELMPNEKFMTQKIVNLSYNKNRVRIHLPLGISYDSDVRDAVFLAKEAALNVDRVLQDPQPACHVTGFGDSSIDINLRVWIKDPENGLTNVKGAVFLAVLDAFGKNGIKIPYPQRDLHIKSGLMQSHDDAGENRSE